jgi:FKBP-type peptidyl-prolyl cis-trans isomerase 2
MNKLINEALNCLKRSNNMAKIKKGDKIKVEYEGTLDDGTVFDSSKGKEPIEFEVGSGKVIPGFDDAVMGMEKGEEKEFKIKADDAYGQTNEKLIQIVPKDKLPKDPAPKEGMMLGVQLPNGQKIPARITKVEADNVTIDLNHPLAGKDLNFKIKIIELN